MKSIVTLILFSLIGLNTVAQTPQTFKYQAVARNTAGEVLANQSVSFRIDILGGSATGTAVYTETHSGKTTNGFGLVDLEIGKGTPVTGTFAGISWGTNNFFLKVEMDPNGGSAWQSMGTSQLLSVPYALYARDVENNADGDADATNELQKISISGTVLTLDKGGQSVTLPTGGTSGDNWGTQTVKTNSTLTGEGTPASPLGVVQTTLAPSWNNLLNVPAGFTDGIDNVDDGDADQTNEIQVMSLSGTVLSLSKGGGTVNLPSSGGGDNWGTQAVVTDATLTGNGTTTTPLKIADNGVTSAKILDGAIVTADLADQTVSTAKLGNLAVSADKIQNGAVITDKLANGSVTGAKIAQASATNGQVLKWDGTTWKPSDDSQGDLILPYSGISNAQNTFIINNGSSIENSTAIAGNSMAASSASAGVAGNSNSTNGRGVTGVANATTGTTMGVFGLSKSGSGKGVYGFADAISGNAFGVAGKTNSPNGSGVTGEGPYTGVSGVATQLEGTPYGVFGEVHAPGGTGVLGWNMSSSGQGFGVKGLNSTLTGCGVLGESLNDGLCGVMGITSSNRGYAIYADARASAGTTFGVKARIWSPEGFSGYFQGGQFYISGNTGIGIEFPSAKLEVNGQIKITGGSPGAGKVLTSDASGLANWQNPLLLLPFSASTFTAVPSFTIINSDIGTPIAGVSTYSGTEEMIYGVYGETLAADGAGIFGNAKSLTGFVAGVYGRSRSDDGYGVQGKATASTGNGIGVYGETGAINGSGVKGEASHISGSTIGVKGVVTSPNGYSGHFTGGKFYVSGNVGIGKTDPTFKLDVSGNRIRLSDANNVNEWIALRTDGSAGFLDLTFSGGNMAIGGSNTGENILLSPATNGWVGVRTWNPQYELDVTGNIRATGSVFYGGTAGAANGTAYNKPDYVFGDGYVGMSTEQVEDFLDREDHLPWVTSAIQEKKENGAVIDMTRMAFETLEAVENLQLQLIEQNKLIQTLKNENDGLKAENVEVIIRIEKLEKLVGGSAQK